MRLWPGCCVRVTLDHRPRSGSGPDPGRAPAWHPDSDPLTLGRLHARLLAHIRGLRHGARFSVGIAITEQVRPAITGSRDWIPAIDADGDLRNGAQIAEITGLVDADGYPQGTRFLVRRERPHAGAQLSLFDTIDEQARAPRLAAEILAPIPTGPRF